MPRGLARVGVRWLAPLAILVAVVTLAAAIPGGRAQAPSQPIAFSHRLHVSDLALACGYCHTLAATDRRAGMPSAQTCMNCHRFVVAGSAAVREEQWRAAREGRRVRRVVSDDLATLYRAQGLDDRLNPDPTLTSAPIAWARVTQFPALAYMHHGAHTRAGVACRDCHGPVERFEVTRAPRALTMGMCIDCHRRGPHEGPDGARLEPPLDCVACHR